MRKELVEEVIALGGDPADQIWHWLLLRGPHGDSFSWGQTRNEPPGYVGLVHLQDIVGELSTADSAFLSKALVIVNKAIRSANPSIARRGIQVAAVIGGRIELKSIASLKSHPDDKVSADARAAEFYLKQRLRSSGE